MSFVWLLKGAISEIGMNASVFTWLMPFEYFVNKDQKDLYIEIHLCINLGPLEEKS